MIQNKVSLGGSPIIKATLVLGKVDQLQSATNGQRHHVLQGSAQSDLPPLSTLHKVAHSSHHAYHVYQAQHVNVAHYCHQVHHVYQAHHVG